MKKVSRLAGIIAIVMALGLGVMMTNAQQGPGPGGPGQGFDPAQMQQRMLDRVKENLKATDDEWKVISPLVEKVMEKQRGTRGMGGFGPMGRGPGGPGPQAAPQSTGDQQGQRQGRGQGRGFGGTPMPEQEALQTALEKESTPAEEIKAKIDALRKARKQREAELQQAREELRKVLTVKQEAQMILTGMLD